jgi:hypothetical protein
VQKHAALQTEFDALNHMLTHQPPSAWAKREKKYHDDKKAWDMKEAEMTGKSKRLLEEVQMLKDNNRAVVLQEQVKVGPSETLVFTSLSTCFQLRGSIKRGGDHVSAGSLTTRNPAPSSGQSLAPSLTGS